MQCFWWDPAWNVEPRVCLNCPGVDHHPKIFCPIIIWLKSSSRVPLSVRLRLLLELGVGLGGVFLFVVIIDCIRCLNIFSTVFTSKLLLDLFFPKSEWSLKGWLIFLAVPALCLFSFPSSVVMFIRRESADRVLLATFTLLVLPILAAVALHYLLPCLFRNIRGLVFFLGHLHCFFIWVWCLSLLFFFLFQQPGQIWLSSQIGDLLASFALSLRTLSLFANVSCASSLFFSSRSASIVRHAKCCVRSSSSLIRSSCCFHTASLFLSSFNRSAEKFFFIARTFFQCFCTGPILELDSQSAKLCLFWETC